MYRDLARRPRRRRGVATRWSSRSRRWRRWASPTRSAGGCRAAPTTRSCARPTLDGGQAGRRDGRSARRGPTLLLALDDAVTEAIAELKERGFQSPYLRAFVVARINPLRFMKGEPPPVDELLPTMTKRARGMDVGKIKPEDVARTGGAPERLSFCCCAVQPFSPPTTAPAGKRPDTACSRWKTAARWRSGIRRQTSEQPIRLFAFELRLHGQRRAGCAARRMSAGAARAFLARPWRLRVAVAVLHRGTGATRLRRGGAGPHRRGVRDRQRRLEVRQHPHRQSFLAPRALERASEIDRLHDLRAVIA